MNENVNVLVYPQSVTLGSRVVVVSAANFMDCIGHTGVVTYILRPDSYGITFDEPKPGRARMTSQKKYDLAFAPHRLQQAPRPPVETVVVC